MNDMDIATETSCPSCNAAITLKANFCSQCGKQIKEPPFSISIVKLLLVYFVSFFLAPFGLGYAFKYLRLSDKRAKRIGTMAIVLTILGITVVVLTASTFMDSFYGSLDTLDF